MLTYRILDEHKLTVNKIYIKESGKFDEFDANIFSLLTTKSIER